LGAPVLNIALSQRSAFTIICAIVGITSALNGILMVPRGILAGLLLTGLRTRRDMIGALGPLIASLFIAFGSPSVILYTIVVQLATLLGGCLVLRATNQVVPWVRHVPGHSRATFRRFLGYSGYQVINQAADTVFLSTDRIVVQLLIGTAGTTNYTIVERLQKLADYVVSIPISAVIPAAAEAWEKGDRRLLERMVGGGTRLYLAVILPPLAVLIGMMRPFLRYWVGARYVHLALAGQLFVLSLAAPAFVRVFAAVLAGRGRFREQVTTKCAYAPVNLAVSIFLASRIGVIGVIIPTTTYYVFIFPLVQFLLMHDEGFSVLRFLLDVLPMFAAVAPVLVILLVTPPSLATSGVAGFGVCALLATAVAYAFSAIVLKPNERALVAAMRKRLG